MLNGGWSDWIDGFQSYTEGISSPKIYRLWAGIAAVAGALERRVWVETARSVVFPNLFTILVGAPGVGKSQAVTPVAELWYETRKFQVAPDNVTKAALVDALQDASKKLITPNGLVEYHSMLVPSSEFGVLIPAHDLEFLSNLNYIFDNPRHYRERRRGIGKEVEIIHPQLNILAGTQPGFLASLMPEEAWSMGFAARLIMIYASEAVAVPLFDEAQDDRSYARKALVTGLLAISGLMGAATWSPEAKAMLQAWIKAGAPPRPQHSKLVHYATRRPLMALKLCMVSAVSRTGEIKIETPDVQRAQDWLIQAEEVMPDIFREMVAKSDSQVISELHFFVWTLQAKTKGAGVHETRIFHFLQNRVPSEKIARIMDIADKANIISRLAGTNHWTARPKHEHGIE